MSTVVINIKMHEDSFEIGTRNLLGVEMDAGYMYRVAHKLGGHCTKDDYSGMYLVIMKEGSEHNLYAVLYEYMTHIDYLIIEDFGNDISVRMV